ncbi:MAG: 16S rRNA (cytosine(1402)-N(4))-methyltransferase, partial [Candidatus Andersenbacteria bacterium RIFCSPLOWO2_02_FULL_46_11]
MTHIPVLLNEVMEGLKVRPGERYIDATVGDGGHAMEMLKRGATVLGIDRDGEAIETAGKRLGNYLKEGKLMLVKGNFDQIGNLASR